MAESFGKYDYHLAKDLCNEAAELATTAREKLQAAHALFLVDRDHPAQSTKDAREADDLGYIAGRLWVRAAELGHM